MPRPEVERLTQAEIGTLLDLLPRLAANLYYMDVPYEPAMEHVNAVRQRLADAALDASERECDDPETLEWMQHREPEPPVAETWAEWQEDEYHAAGMP